MASSESQSPELKRRRMVDDKEDKEEQLPLPPDPDHEEPGSDNNGDETGDEVIHSKLAEALAKKRKVMTNPIVLERIADRLPAQDLLNLRETCPGWNSIFIPQLMEKHSPIELDFDFGSCYEQSMHNFTKVMKSSSKIPFSNYMLANSRYCRADLLDFGSVAGHTVKILSIHWFWDEDWKTSKIHQLIFEQLPYLTDLELLFPERRRHGQLSQFPTTLSLTDKKLPALKRFSFNFTSQQPAGSWQLVSEVVHCANELSELRLPCPSHDEDGYGTYESSLEPVLREMWNSNGNIHKLKVLEIGNVNHSILDSLLGMARQKKGALCLEVFAMSVTGPGWHDAELNAQNDEGHNRRVSEMWGKVKSFLEKQAPTLRELSLWLNEEGTDEVVNLPIILPRMAQLHALTIDYPDRPLYAYIFPDLKFDGDTFESTLPGLKKLKYFIDDSYAEDEIHEEEWRKIGHARLTEIFLEVSIEQLLTLPTLFPAVTRLDLDLRAANNCFRIENPEVFANIWTLWPGLTHLNLKIEVMSGITVNPDKLLTGVRGGQLGALKLELESLTREHRPTFEQLGALARKYKTRPGIADLNRLVEFQFQFEWWAWQYGKAAPHTLHLSDIAVYCGLALVGPQLQNITFVDEVGKLLSENSLHFIKGHGQGPVGAPNLPNTSIEFKE